MSRAVPGSGGVVGAHPPPVDVYTDEMATWTEAEPQLADGRAGKTELRGVNAAAAKILIAVRDRIAGDALFVCPASGLIRSRAIQR